MILVSNNNQQLIISFTYVQMMNQSTSMILDFYNLYLVSFQSQHLIFSKKTNILTRNRKISYFIMTKNYYEGYLQCIQNKSNLHSMKNILLFFLIFSISQIIKLISMYDLETHYIHPTLQLKINELLSKPVHKLNFNNAEFILCINQDRSLSILHSSNHLQNYLKLYVLKNSKRAKMILGEDNKLKQIFSLGGNVMTLYIQSDKGELIKVASKQLELDSKQEILHLSDLIQMQQNFGVVIVTNYGRTHLCKIVEEQIQIQTLQITNQIYNKLVQFALRPFLAPPQQYQYCSTAISRIDDNRNSLYLYVVRQLNICQIFINESELGQQPKQSNSKYNVQWNSDIQAYFQKSGNKVKEVWFTKIFELNFEQFSKDKVYFLAGISYQNSEGDNFSALAYLKLDFINGKSLAQYVWTIPIVANFTQSQILLFNSNLYFLARGIQNHRSQLQGKSVLFQLSLLQGLILTKQTFLGSGCSISLDEQYIFLFTQTQTFVLEKTERSKSQYQNQRLEEKFENLNKQYLRDIQRQMIQNNPEGIIEILRKKKQKMKRFVLPRAQFQDEQREIDERIKLDINQLQIDIASKLLQIGIFKDQNQFPLDQFQEIFTKNDDNKLSYLFNECLQMQQPQYFLQILETVVVPTARKEPLLLPYIREKFENTINEYLTFFKDDQKFITEENKLLILAISINQYPIQMFSYYVRERNKGKLLLNYLKKSDQKDQNLLIVLYCESNLISDLDIKEYIENKLAQNIGTTTILDFIYKLLNHNLLLIAEKQSRKPNLSLLEYLQPFYDQIYKYLQQSYPSLAWILLLKMKQRQNYEIVQASQKMKDPIYVKSILHSAHDIPNAQVKSIQIMSDICNHLDIDYIDAITFINQLKFDKQIQQILFKNKRAIPMKWWNDLKQCCLSQMAQNQLKNLEKRLKFE